MKKVIMIYVFFHAFFCVFFYAFSYVLRNIFNTKFTRMFIYVVVFNITLMGSLLPSISLATIVHDPINYGELVTTYHKLVEQYQLLQKTYQNAMQQLDTAKEIARDTEGHYGFGRLFNGIEEFKNRQWSPKEWQAALKGLSGGNPERYQELVQAYTTSHPVLSTSDFTHGATQAQAEIYQRDIQVNRAVSVNTTYAFNDLQEHLNTIYQLSQKIDKSENTKAATDLNSRILTEMAYIQMQELKMQTLLNQQLAQVNADTIALESQRAQFNTLPDERQA